MVRDWKADGREVGGEQITVWQEEVEIVSSCAIIQNTNVFQLLGLPASVDGRNSTACRGVIEVHADGVNE